MHGTENRLFVEALEAIYVTASRDRYGRWNGKLGYRRGGEAFSDHPATFLDCLTSSELLDQVCSELGTLL